MAADGFALMLMAVMAVTALPAWAWWAAADDDGPEVVPDHRLQAAIEASAHPTCPPLPPQLKELA